MEFGEQQRIGPTVAGRLFPALCSRNRKPRSRWRKESTKDCFVWKKDQDQIWNASTRSLCSGGNAFFECGTCLLSHHPPWSSSPLASASPGGYAVQFLVGFWQILRLTLIGLCILTLDPNTLNRPQL
ncbi:hypothetical protein V8G54_003437, partial [Vigna mungo]